MKNKIILVIAAIMLAGPIAHAISETIPVQGKLTDTQGNALTGTYSMLFELYDNNLGGNLLWAETHNTTTANGVFNTTLGDANTNTYLNSVDFNTQTWLSILVDGTRQQPMIKLGSGPSAFSSKHTYGGDSNFANIEVKGTIFGGSPVVVRGGLNVASGTLNVASGDTNVANIGASGTIFGNLDGSLIDPANSFPFSWNSGNSRWSTSGDMAVGQIYSNYYTSDLAGELFYGTASGMEMKTTLDMKGQILKANQITSSTGGDISFDGYNVIDMIDLHIDGDFYLDEEDNQKIYLGESNDISIEYEPNQPGLVINGGTTGFETGSNFSAYIGSYFDSAGHFYGPDGLEFIAIDGGGSGGAFYATDGTVNMYGPHGYALNIDAGGTANAQIFNSAGESKFTDGTNTIAFFNENVIDNVIDIDDSTLTIDGSGNLATTGDGNFSDLGVSGIPYFDNNFAIKRGTDNTIFTCGVDAAGNLKCWE